MAWPRPGHPDDEDPVLLIEVGTSPATSPQATALIPSRFLRVMRTKSAERLVIVRSAVSMLANAAEAASQKEHRKSVISIPIQA